MTSMKAEYRTETTARSIGRVPKWYLYPTAAIFAGIGLVMLYSALDNVPPLRQRDALFGLTNRTMLVVAGIAHLALSGYFFWGQDLVNRGLLALWAGLNYIVYYAGTAWVMKVATPFPPVVVIGWETGIKPSVVDLLWKLFTVYLILGGLLLLVLERRRLKKLEAEAFLEHWHEMREHGGSPPAAKSPRSPNRPLES